MKNKELNIKYRPIKELKPYKKNAKKHNKEQVEQIANSIKEFGFTQPVIIDKHDCVVAGHGRILGAKKAGLKQVPTVCLDELTEEQIKAYRLVDNKLNESEWDYSLLDEEIEQLTDMDMDLFGFDEVVEITKDDEAKKKVEFEIKEKYEVHIICKDEKQMEQVFNKVKGYGKECKLVSTL
jgi:ParB-like chromosome segregation protein Spo0J